MVLTKTHSLERSIGDLSCSSSEMGDHIGMESCVDLNHNDYQEEFNQTVVEDDHDHDHHHHRRSSSIGRRDRRCEMMIKKREKKEYPPPIPWLARTENLPSHMPWVMKRYHTSDGRLIIKEEKVKHHEYFRAHRSNGRLTLHLVPLDDDDDVLVGQNEITNEVVERLEEDDQDNDDGILDGGDESEDGEEDRTVMMGYNFNSVRTSSCIFDMIVPAIRPPVHI